MRAVGFVDDDPAKRAMSYRGVPVVGITAEAARIVEEKRVDAVFLALPLEAHRTMLAVLKDVARTVADVRVVPDLLQHITFRAGVEDLDGLPVVHLTQVPLTGWMSLVKRTLDLAIAAVALVLLSPLFAVIAARDPALGGPTCSVPAAAHGPGRPTVRDPEVPVDAARGGGRVGSDVGGAGRSAADGGRPVPPALEPGRAARSSSTSSRARCRSSGRDPSAPSSSASSRKSSRSTWCATGCAAGITGWAQVHGWRGNTSVSKRIEYDLYYIENWSLALDLKILWMTLRYGLRHRNAY